MLNSNFSVEKFMWFYSSLTLYDIMLQNEGFWVELKLIDYNLLQFVLSHLTNSD